MKIEIKNNGIKDCTVLVAEDGKDLYNNFLDIRAGKENWLGYIYYDKNGELLSQPYLLTQTDFSEVDEEIISEEVDEGNIEEI